MTEKAYNQARFKAWMTVQYNTVQYHTLQYSTIQYITANNLHQL